jgi:hypothetical protein
MHVIGHRAYFCPSRGFVGGLIITFSFLPGFRLVFLPKTLIFCLACSLFRWVLVCLFVLAYGCSRVFLSSASGQVLASPLFFPAVSPFSVCFLGPVRAAAFSRTGENRFAAFSLR